MKIDANRCNQRNTPKKPLVLLFPVVAVVVRACYHSLKQAKKNKTLQQRLDRWKTLRSGSQFVIPGYLAPNFVGISCLNLGCFLLASFYFLRLSILSLHTSLPLDSGSLSLSAVHCDFLFWPVVFFGIVLLLLLNLQIELKGIHQTFAPPKVEVYLCAHERQCEFGDCYIVT